MNKSNKNYIRELLVEHLPKLLVKWNFFKAYLKFLITFPDKS